MQQTLKQRYNQTLCFLKQADLYDLTMKVAEFLKKNSQLQLEIESLRAECANGYCYPATAY